MDSGASYHMSSYPSTLSNPKPFPSSSRVIVGNGSIMQINHIGHASLPPFHLNNVLIVPNLVKNLISVHKFTADNCC